jgi:4-O-beta-D-mannosyl-D-glucose phosphorylase
VKWERLPDLKTNSPQQRNVVLHPEFVDGKYALYTRPQDGFISAGTGGGIGFGFAIVWKMPLLMRKPLSIIKIPYRLRSQKRAGPNAYKNGKGWLHLAHGVRNTAAGLRYVLYMFMTDLHDLTKVLPTNPAAIF